jgi:hypothetical protein
MRGRLKRDGGLSRRTLRKANRKEADALKALHPDRALPCRWEEAWQFAQECRALLWPTLIVLPNDDSKARSRAGVSSLSSSVPRHSARNYRFGDQDCI